MSKIKVQGSEITVLNQEQGDFISLSDMIANQEDGSRLIEKWLTTKHTLEFLGVWESLNNHNFNSPEFGVIRNEAGSNKFYMSVKQWVNKTQAIGIIAKTGRYGGTYAHKDIAFHFGMYISPMFNLLLIKEFQRLKEDENKTKNLEWDYRRFLTKVNYKIHTNAVKEILATQHTNLSKEEESYIYANEAEMLNLAVFGITSKKWKDQNPDAVLNGLSLREVASIPQLTVLANIEYHNSILVKESLNIKDRFIKLQNAAQTELKSLAINKYNYPIQSPKLIKYEQTTTFDKTLKNILKVPKPKE